MRRNQLDQPLLLALFLALGIGLVQVYSASYIFAIENHNDGLFYFKKQLLYAGVSALLFLIVYKTPWDWIEKFSKWIWIPLTVLMLATLVSPIAVKVNGASRWLQLPFFRLQPSEILKIFVPLVWASLFLEYKFQKDNWWKDLIKLVYFLLPIVLLLRQPDFGTFVICCITILSILFSYGMKWRYIFASTATAFIFFIGLIWAVPYRRARLMTFFDPWSDASGSGFQVIQSMMSFYSGGVTGVGLGQGQGKLFFLPEAHTDFTLAVLAEETGFIGLLFVICLYAYIIFKSMQISIQAKTKFQQCVAVGLVSCFSFQVFINMGVTMGILPTKGITLPFLSYGGSSLLGVAILFGLLLNIKRSSIDAKKV
ncbi:MAG: putative lipid II flippase FtsW [Bdellovibrionales bacterium]|nr:putative lipid II flippase FtsW [Bdellovibrionales bacterium]